jgi:hypothetical protein
MFRDGCERYGERLGELGHRCLPTSEPVNEGEAHGTPEGSQRGREVRTFNHMVECYRVDSRLVKLCGMVYVAPAAITTDEDLERWVDLAVTVALTQSPSRS